MSSSAIRPAPGPDESSLARAIPLQAAAALPDRRAWVVMCSGSPWRAAAHRQQALARELAGPYRVLFVDPPSNRPRWSFEVNPIVDSLWHARVPSPVPLGRQLEPANRAGRFVTAALLRRWLDARPGPRILWLDEDLAAPLAGQLAEAAVVYDATDLDWTFTRAWNRPHLRRALVSAVGAADLVLASSSALPDRLPASRRPVRVVPNACDPEHFTPAGPIASWLADLPRPRLVYLGAVDTRAFDADLVATVALDRPDWTFVLVGPSTRAGRAPLAGLPNVHLFDPVPYAQAPAVVRGGDVGIIPYRVGGLIDYVQPKKCYEYLAVGKPVVAMALPALVSLAAPIELAMGPVGFTAAVTRALTVVDSAPDIARRRAAAVANSWSVRGEQVAAMLAELVAC